MRTWDTLGLEVEAHKPRIVSTTDAARVLLLNLPAGERLQEHEVHERAYLVVVDGEVEVELPGGGETISGGPGLVATFAPHERHTVRATSDTRLLLVLAPWPGDGHPGARD